MADSPWTVVPAYDTPVATVRGALEDLRDALLCRLIGHRYERYFIYHKAHRSCDRCRESWEADLHDLSTSELLSLLEEQCQNWFGMDYNGFCHQRRRDEYASEKKLNPHDIGPINTIERVITDRGI